MWQEVDLDDMEYEEDAQRFCHPCRCSGRFVITEDQLEEGCALCLWHMLLFAVPPGRRGAAVLIVVCVTVQV